MPCFVAYFDAIRDTEFASNTPVFPPWRVSLTPGNSSLGNWRTGCEGLNENLPRWLSDASNSLVVSHSQAIHSVFVGLISKMVLVRKPMADELPKLMFLRMQPITHFQPHWIWAESVSHVRSARKLGL